MRIDRDELLARVDLRELADQLLGVDRSSMRAPMWPCPVATHAQSGRTPPMSIFVSRIGEQRWHCHGCGDGGTAIDLVMHRRGLDVGAAIAWLADRAGTIHHPPPSIPEQAAKRGPPTCTEPIPELQDYVAACETALWDRAPQAVRWLTDTRGLSQAVIRANRLGFDPGPRQLPRPAGIPRARGIVIPVVDDDGKAIFTQTRRTADKVTGPRYLNCAGRAAPNPRLALYQSRSARHSHQDGELVVCEGAIDALTVADADIRAAALLGSTLADHDVASRIAAHGSEVIVAFDNDDAGNRGARELTELLTDHEVSVRRLRPPRLVTDVNEWRLETVNGWTQELRSAVERARGSTCTIELALG